MKRTSSNKKLYALTIRVPKGTLDPTPIPRGHMQVIVKGIDMSGQVVMERHAHGSGWLANNIQQSLKDIVLQAGLDELNKPVRKRIVRMVVDVAFPMNTFDDAQWLASLKRRKKA